MIAGDSVYSNTLHLWLADLLTPALTEAWLSTLDFIQHIRPKKIVPGHSLVLGNFRSTVDLEHSRRYVRFFQDEIESKGIDFFTPQEISDKLNAEFPGLLASNTSLTSATLLNVTAEEFGRGGTRLVRSFDLTFYNDVQQLEGWNLA